MKELDYLIVAENATMGQDVYTSQRKDMLEESGYSVKKINFNSPKMRITLDMFRIAYIYRKNLEKYLKTCNPRIIEFYCPATLILQDDKLLKDFKIIASFDLPFGVNTRNFGSNILHRLERRKFNNADLIISLTKYGEDFLRSIYGIKRKIVHLPYVLNPEELKNITASDGGFTVSYCPESRFDRKGFDILVKAWNGINTEKKLIVMGTDKKSATRYLLKKGIALPENIEFTSFLPREELLSLLSSCSYFISSSRYEEFGQIIIEMLSLGKTVISTPTIGPSEFISGIDKKLISPTFSPTDLRRTIEYAERSSSDPHIKAGLNQFIKTYNYDLVKSNLNKEVEALLKGGGNNS